MENKLSVQFLIDESLRKEQDKRKDYVRSGKYSPSMLGRCYRAQYLNRKNVAESEPLDERVLRTFKVGRLFEDFVVSVFAPGVKQALVEDENFKGFADVNPDIDRVIEIKSVHSRSFWYMDKPGYDIDKAKEPNILQNLFYCLKLGKEWAHLVFVSRDDLCVREYGFSLTRWKEKLIKEINTLVNYWNKQELPPAEPRAFVEEKTGKSRECQYCRYKTLCENIESGVVKWNS